jgi:cysteinyl-tRNA synthetase
MSFDNEDDVEVNEKAVQQIEGIISNCYRAMNDDFNTASTIAQLFNLLKKINSLSTGNLKFGEIGQAAFDKLKSTYVIFVEDVLGIREEKPENVEGILGILLDLYAEAKKQKDYDKVDQIRARLKKFGIVLKDMKSKIDWAYEEE